MYVQLLTTIGEVEFTWKRFFWRAISRRNSCAEYTKKILSCKYNWKERKENDTQNKTNLWNRIIYF